MAGAFEGLARLACLASLLLLAGCRLKDDLVAERVLNASGAGGSLDDPALPPSNECSPDRASISLPLADGTRYSRCSAWAARRSFSHAVCSCTDLDVPGAVVTEAFDSFERDAGAGQGAAAVGVNGTIQGVDYVNVDGSFTVAGDAAIDIPGGFDVSGDLRLGGATRAAGPILVSRDAWLGGDTETLSVANIGRNLHLSGNAALQPLVPAMVGGDTFQDPFDVAPPCACAASETLDIAGIVLGAISDNDNARIGLGLDALADVTTATEVELSCGRFALRGIAGSAPISIRVSGRVSLAVEGDVLLPLGFSLLLEPGAQLDWFISGNLSLNLDTRIGDRERLSAVRAYVLGDGEIVVPGNELLTMNVYAPRASVMVETLGNAYGAVFAGAIASRTVLITHYDRAVLRADDDCTLEPPAICTSCDQCQSTSTCLSGSCTACGTDADCCSPLVCELGQCQGLVAN